MARGRMIDKVIILSKKINAISEGAENLYYRIYVSTDDFGLFHADPKILKGQIYTLRSITVATIEKRLTELIEIGLIRVYENNSEKYLEIVDFEKHQTFRKDYVRKYEYPKPNTNSYEAVRTHTESPTNINKIKLNKNKVKESELTKAPDPPHLRIKFNFKEKKWQGIIDEDIERWKKTFPDVDFEYHVFTKMVDWIILNPRKGRKKNYARFINNWLSDEQEKFDLKNTGKRRDAKRAKEWLKEKD